LRVTIRHSKTDQEGNGHVIAIPSGVIACPVVALRAWLEAAAITEGAVFRPVAKGGRIQATRLTDRSVADIVKALPNAPDSIPSYLLATRCAQAF
jgi:hypothetical protein